ncbi:purine and uridine phosphorylase [Aspergillus californicus]
MSLKRRRLRCEDYTVGWVCALPVELAAAKAILDEEDYCFPHDKENFLYTLGRVGDHNVVIACLPAGQMGTNSAATVAVQVKSKFTSIRFGLMVGVGGGVPGRIDIRLGDVVVSQPENNHGGVVQYDFGKATHGNGFRRIGLLNPPPTALLSAVAEVKANQILGRSSLMKFLEPLAGRPVFAAKNLGPDVLFRSTYAHVGGTTCDLCSTEKKIPRDPRPNHDVVVHYGTIASGNCVMKDGITRDRIDVELGGVLCYEMEAAGLMNSFPCLVIRGICDYADSHKNKRWQPYASATAAACAKEILSVIPAAVVAPMETVNDAVRLEERVRSAIATVDLHEFLSMLPVANQEEQVSPQQALDRGDPAFTWIFQNIDFEAWSNHDGPPVLWLSGAPEQNLPLVSSYVVNKKIFETSKTKGLVLYFFLSLDVRGKSLMTVFISTLLHQFLKSFSMEESVPLARLFLAVLGRRLIEWAARHPDTVSMGSHMILKHVLDLPVEDLQYALAVLLLNAPQGFSLIIDGLDRALHPQREFLGGVQNFIKLVSRGLEQDGSNFYVLLTSRPGVELNAILPLVRAIKYDKERQGLLSPGKECTK